jgi:TonB family protein
LVNPVNRGQKFDCFQILPALDYERKKIVIKRKPTVNKLAGRAVWALILSVVALNLAAQENRKAIAKPVPAYPETARRLGLTGVVKVEVVIGSDGRIKETRVIGGHPLLVSAVEETLKNWKYAPANGETTAQLQFNFHP